MGHEHVSRRGLVLLIMTAGYLLVLLDVTIINVTLPSIRAAWGRKWAPCNGLWTATRWPWRACF
jgi:cyanate permease